MEKKEGEGKFCREEGGEERERTREIKGKEGRGRGRERARWKRQLEGEKTEGKIGRGQSG